MAIVRRAGKSPPGGARRARPRRASIGPSRRTDPRRRPTMLLWGSSRTTSAHRIRRVFVPIPSTLAPRSASIRAITSTSEIRGMFVSTHSWSVSRHAAIRGSAAFLLPPTTTRPESGLPPSINNVDTVTPQAILRSYDPGILRSPANLCTQVPDLFAQCHPEAGADFGAAEIDQRADVRRARSPVVDDEVRVRGGYAGAADGVPLEAGAVDQRSGRYGNAVGHAIAHRVRILKDAACARGVEGLGPFPVRQRGARILPKGPRVGRGCQREQDRQRHLSGPLKSAAVGSKLHVARGDLHNLVVPGHEADGRDQLGD